MKRPGTLDTGVLMESSCRLMFVVATMFVGYRLVIECSKSVYLHDYFASLYPDGLSKQVCEQAYRNCTDPVSWSVPILICFYFNAVVNELWNIKDSETGQGTANFCKGTTLFPNLEHWARVFEKHRCTTKYLLHRYSENVETLLWRAQTRSCILHGI